MSATIIAFFNNKGGVGNTFLVYHLAWMFADMGVRLVAADLDPQANLSAAFLDEDRLVELLPDRGRPNTVFGCLQPLLRGPGDISDPHPEEIEDQLALLVGDLSLSGLEEELSARWPECMDGKERAFSVISAFWRVLQKAARAFESHVVLLDLGPNLGAINRAALIASDYVVVPLSLDLFSLQGLRSFGPTLRRWRREWEERLKKNPAADLKLPSGRMEPAGYIALRHTERFDRPVKAYDRWIGRIPEVYRSALLDETGDKGVSMADDRHCLTLLKNYRLLMSLAREARKPMFFLKPADGAIGEAHLKAVHSTYEDFRKLAEEIAARTGIALP